MDHLPIEDHLDEAGIGDFVAVGVETRGMENHIQGLPFSGLASGVRARRDAFVDVMVLRLLFRTGIDAAAVRPFGLLHAKAVENLNFIKTFELDSRVRAFGNQEFDMSFDVPKVLLGDEVDRSSLSSVNENALAGLSLQH